LSDLCGQKTVTVKSRSQTTDGRASWNESPHGFPLFRPEDLMKLPPGQMLCLVAGVDPFFTLADGYWDTVYGRGLDPNPYFQS
jgi:type IV secretory pathway TraG/TraD family ATPase VirD4